MRWLRRSMMLAIAITLAALIIPSIARVRQNSPQGKVGRITVGMTVPEVEAIMGRPPTNRILPASMHPLAALRGWDSKNSEADREITCLWYLGETDVWNMRATPLIWVKFRDGLVCEKEFSEGSPPTTLGGRFGRWLQNIGLR
jgi:hypothetical protein